MKILAVDTSTKVLSIAIWNDDELITSLNRLLGKRHSSDLVPMIDELLKLSNLSLSGIDGFAVGVGPGSFTGLRVGITTMKGLAFTTGKPIIGISSLDAIAYNAIGSSWIICPIIDAKRNKIYSAIYRSRAGKLKRLSRYLLLSAEDLLKRIDEPTLFLGDGVELYRGKIIKSKKTKAKFAPKPLWFPRASIVAALAMERLKKGISDNSFDIVPMYLYPSTAQVTRLDANKR